MPASLVIHFFALVACNFLPRGAAAVACSALSGSGECIDTRSAGCPDGLLAPGACPGPAYEQCCVTDWGTCPSGKCQVDTLPCAGHYDAGVCPGPDAVRCCSTAPPGPAGVLGVDVDWQDDYGLGVWKCFRSANVSFAIIEAVNGGLGINKGLAATVSAARSAGLRRVDLYVFTSPGTIADPTDALARTFAALAPGNSTYNTVWLDIEQCTGCWTAAATNEAYIAAAIAFAQSHGVHVGIYSSAHEWPLVMGTSSAFSKLPLWYANYDQAKNYDDFGAGFAGWTVKDVRMKQFFDQFAGCGVDADANWSPTAW